MVRKLLSLAAVAAMALNANAYDLPLTSEDTGANAPLYSGWSSTYDQETQTITYEGDWTGRGWWFGNMDLSDYSNVVIKCEPSNVPGQVVIQYNGTDSSTTVGFSIGDQEVICPLDEEYKADVMQIYIQCGAISGIESPTITLISAEIVSELVMDPVRVIYEGDFELSDWNGLEIAAGKFVNVKEGDKIAIDFTTTDGGSYKLNWVDQDWYWNLMTSMSSAQNYNEEYGTSWVSASGVQTIILDAEDAENLTSGAARSVIIQGDGLVINKVRIVEEGYIAYPCETVGHTMGLDDDSVPFVAMPDVNVTIDEDYVLLKAWAGAEGYDLKVYYDEDYQVTGVSSVINGEEGEVVFGNYLATYTGNDDYYWAQLYVGEGYVDLDPSEDGYAVIYYCYFYKDSQTYEEMSYYVGWPVTAEELISDMDGLDDYETDKDWVEELTIACDELKAIMEETYPGFAVSAAEEWAAMYDTIDSLKDDIQAGLLGAFAYYEYEGISAEAMGASFDQLQALNEKMQLDREAIDKDMEADIARTDPYYAAIETIMNGAECSEETWAAACDVMIKISDMSEAAWKAQEKAIQETGVYESPFTDKDFEELDALLKAFEATSGISAITMGSTTAKYYDINGVEVANPTSGKVYIKVVNGKAVKALVK